ncbi:GTP-binding protein [Anaerotruncus sp. 80]|uniref:GTP-binding protein n=1 Tax=Anaerotruncus colihominis TaxID=169435 RepID=A0A845QJL6_9FIRM|nr:MULTISPECIES: CobW family GTP-binding protein [Anaerotruncus]NBH60298.1 GTP-binding protein [Anaerotruncus colihominis]NCF00952.1 GTP-binding protein [Anaerotruncus sp. 80]
MIQIVLLSGFLGAGKTTLMQRLLDTYQEHKIGVIINEFGEINIDAKLVSRDGIDIAELSNGSIFCACIKDKFVDGLIEMSKTDIEYLFIEASGLADPSNMGDIVDGIKKDTNDNYLIKGNICVADSCNFLELVEVLPALERQVKHANAVIVNKMDLIDDETFKEIAEKIAEINESTKIYAATQCDVDIKDIVDNFAPSLVRSEDTTNTYESRPQTFIVKADQPVEKEKLIAFIKSISDSSYRIKGFCQTIEEGTVEVSGVVNNLIITPWKTEEKTEIVVISSVGIKMMSLITENAKNILEGRFYI